MTFMQKFKNSNVEVDGRNVYILRYEEVILAYPKWSWVATADVLSDMFLHH